MANPGDQVAHRRDALARQGTDLQRQLREGLSARSLAASTIGNGGLTVKDGGSITIEGTGALNVGTGALNSAGSISAADDISAGDDITAGGDITGGSIHSTGNSQVDGSETVNGNVSVGGSVGASGTVTANAGMNSIGVYNNLLTSGYRGMWVRTPTGEYGYVPSSRLFKRDEAPALLDPALVRRLQLVTFRYIAAVEEFGDDAAIEWGLIAEEVHALGLFWLVDYDDNGLPFGLKLEKLALAILPVVQDDDRRITEVERRLDAAGL